MSKLLVHNGVFRIFFAIFILALSINTPISFAEGIDTAKYYPFEEIHPGMDAYCLTVLSGTKIEKFPLKVISTVRNYRPGLNRILVIGTDETFKKIGPVQGCSGSPVYIDDRLIGALSAGYPLSTEPIYMVTPIGEMLTIGTAPSENYPSDAAADDKPDIDLSQPIDLDTVSEDLLARFKTLLARPSSRPNPVSLVTSLPDAALDELKETLTPLNMVPIADVSSSTSLNFACDTETVDSYRPGGILSLPLLSGDITIAAIGTITEVIDDKVYGFGHDFIGYGKLNIPMATGHIHTVIPNLQMSFKLGTPGPISGTLIFDEFTGVVGRVGQRPNLIPLNIIVDRYNDTQTRTYKCNLAYHNLYSPVLLRAAIGGACVMKGALPDHHTVSYKFTIAIDGRDPIVFDDISSDRQLLEVTSNAMGVLGLLIDNPYSERIKVNSVDVEIKITPFDTLAFIDSVQISDKTLKPGQTIDLDIVLERYKTEKILYKMQMTVPSDIQPGQYPLYVVGGDTYEQILTSLSPHKFSARSVPTLIDALDNLSKIKHDRLYVILQLPPKGITIMEKELPSLPNTKTLVLASPIRTTEIKPYNPWIEQSINAQNVVSGGREMTVVVEK